MFTLTMSILGGTTVYVIRVIWSPAVLPARILRTTRAEQRLHITAAFATGVKKTKDERSQRARRGNLERSEVAATRNSDDYIQRPVGPLSTPDSGAKLYRKRR